MVSSSQSVFSPLHSERKCHFLGLRFIMLISKWERPLLSFSPGWTELFILLLASDEEQILLLCVECGPEVAWNIGHWRSVMDGGKVDRERSSGTRVWSDDNYIDIRATVSNCPTITETARSNDKYIVLSLRCPEMYGVSGKEALLSIISLLVNQPGGTEL